MLPICAAAICIVCPNITSYPASTDFSGGDCLHAEDTPFVVELKINSTLSNYDSELADIVVSGNNVRVTNVTVSKSIRVTSDQAINVSFTNVNCIQCESAVVVTGSETVKHGAVEVDIAIENVTGLNYALALAHTVGTVTCRDAVSSILVQPVGGSRTVGNGCNTTDLGELLSVYGEPYLLNFFDGPAHKTGTLVFLVKVMTCVTVLVVVVSYLSAYHVWQTLRRKEHQD